MIEMQEFSNIMPPPINMQVQTEFTDEEWQVRVDLAMAYRLFNYFGYTDLTHTHLSVRVPGRHDQFLQLPYGYLFEEAAASSLVKCDTEGHILSDPTGLGISVGGFVIHSAVHTGVENAAVVMHAHTPATIAVSCQADGLLPWTQDAMMFHGHVAYLDYSARLSGPDGRRALVEAIGDANVLMLRSHGPLVIGRSVWEAFSRMYYLEKACRLQLEIQQAGVRIVPPSDEEIAFVSFAFQDSDQRESRREWDALKRTMCRKDGTFAL